MIVDDCSSGRPVLGSLYDYYRIRRSLLVKHMDTEEHARSPLDEEDITESSAAGMASGDAHAKGKKKVLWSLPVDGEDTGREEKLDELEKSLSLALPEANRPVQDRSKGELSVPSRGVLRNSGSSTPQIEIPNVDDGVSHHPCWQIVAPYSAPRNRR